MMVLPAVVRGWLRADINVLSPRGARHLESVDDAAIEMAAVPPAVPRKKYACQDASIKAISPKMPHCRIIAKSRRVVIE